MDVFRGNLRNLSLPEILQTLSAGGKEGILALESPGSAAEILVKDGEVTVVEAEFDQRPGLVHQCRALGLIDEPTAARILDPRARTGRSITDLLRREAGVSNEDIEQLRRLWFQDRILALFDRKEGAFAFREEAGVGRRISNGSVPTFPIDAVVMEAARQRDEWSLMAATLPHGRILLEPTGAPVELDEDAREILGHVQALLDGQTPLEDAIDRSYLSRFDFFKWASGFVQAGALRRVAGPALLASARSLAASADPEARRRALALFDSYLADSPDDAAIALERGRLLWNLGRRAEAADVLVAGLPFLLAQGRAAEAFGRVAEALEALPDHAPLEETVARFFPEHLGALGDLAPRAIDRALALVERWGRERRGEDALALLEHVLEIDSANEAARHRAINLAIDIGRTDRAAEHYEKMAAYCVATGEWKKLVDIYQRILRLDPRRPGVSKKLQQAQEKLNLASPVYRARKWKGRAAIASGVVLVLVIGVLQYRSYALYRDLGVDALLGERRYEEAIDALEGYRASHPLSIANLLAANRLSAVRAELASFRAERTAKMKPERDRAARLAETGDFKGALAAFQGILDGPLTEDFRLEARDHVARIQEESQALEELRKKAADALARGEYEEAFYTTRQILSTFAARPFVLASVRLPVHLVSVPADARLEVEGADLGAVGANRVLEVAPGGKIAVSLSRPGYDPVAVTIGVDSPRVEAFLSKRALWEHETRLSLEHVPVVGEGSIYLSTADGEIVAYSLADSGRLAESWRFRAERPVRFRLAQATLGPGTVLAAADDGQLYAVGPGGEKWRMPTGGRTLGRPAIAPGGKRIAVVLDRTRVAFFPADGGVKEWSWPERVEGDVSVVGDPLLFSDGRALVALSDRRVALLDPEARTVVWEKILPYAPAATPARCGTEVLIPTANLFALRIRLADGESADGPSLMPKRPLFAPVEKDGRVLVFLAESHLFVHDGPRENGGKGPRFPRVRVEPRGQPIVTGSAVAYCGPGSVVALDFGTLAPAWTYDGKGETFLGPVDAGRFLLVATSAGRLVALEP